MNKKYKNIVVMFFSFILIICDGLVYADDQELQANGPKLKVADINYILRRAGDEADFIDYLTGEYKITFLLPKNKTSEPYDAAVGMVDYDGKVHFAEEIDGGMGCPGSRDGRPRGCPGLRRRRRPCAPPGRPHRSRCSAAR